MNLQEALRVVLALAEEKAIQEIDVRACPGLASEYRKEQDAFAVIRAHCPDHPEAWKRQSILMDKSKEYAYRALMDYGDETPEEFQRIKAAGAAKLRGDHVAVQAALRALKGELQ